MILRADTQEATALRGATGGNHAGANRGSSPAALRSTPLTWTHPCEMLGLLCALPEVSLACLTFHFQEFAPTQLPDPG